MIFAIVVVLYDFTTSFLFLQVMLAYIIFISPFEIWVHVKFCNGNLKQLQWLF